jgi:S1-C subfamily serine protease
MISVLLALACRRLGRSMATLAIGSMALAAYAAPSDTIDRVKPSVVAVGTFQPDRRPQFEFRGSGFAIGDGTMIATNAHVAAKVLDGERFETYAVAIPMEGRAAVREVRKIAVDLEHDLAILKLTGGRPLPALPLSETPAARDGEFFLFTGFPIGSVLGLTPVTHRAMLSATTPIALPRPDTAQLDPITVKRLASEVFGIYQLDATAYPGNSGSPLYNEATGDVIGIVNMVFVKGTKENVLSQPSGISYAIPSNYLVNLLRTIK